jgi:hypothetical protein
MLTITALLVQIHLLRQQGVTSQQQESAVSILPFVASRSDKIGKSAVLPSSKRPANSTTPDWLSEDVLQEMAALISRI